ncbi:MAG: matrixin family metalloprotease [Candidatus Kariarchaeaceae archaeon]
MKRKFTFTFFVLGLSLLVPSIQNANTSPTVDETAVLAQMNEINAQLDALGLGIAVEGIDFFTVGYGRSSVRMHQQPFRWVPNDLNRGAQGNDLTYLVDQSDGATASGLSNAQTEAAIDSAMDTWDNLQALRKIDIVKQADPGIDVDIYDFFFGFGGYGYPFAADIVNAGWYPWEFFEAVGGPGGGAGILAFSVTFIWLDDFGFPTDIDGNNYLDTALNEVYFNDGFGDPSYPIRAGNPWGIDVGLPGIDVETVALHENGHSLGLGHFDGPVAVMNAFYAGVNQSPDPIDKAGMSIIYNSWPTD